jgi:TatD DNase family protein
MIGLGGNITYKRSNHSIELIKLIPLDQIMVETDAPYLSPEPVRGTRNESKNIKYVIEKLANIKNVDIDILQKILYENSLKFYRIETES